MVLQFLARKEAPKIVKPPARKIQKKCTTFVYITVIIAQIRVNTCTKMKMLAICTSIAAVVMLA